MATEIDCKKLVHDMNSDLSSLKQGFNLIDNELAEEDTRIKFLADLSLKKIDNILKNWELVKDQLR